MKKFFFLSVLASAMFVSCSMPTKLTNSATHNKVNALEPFAAVFADLKVSPTKISFFYIPSQTVANAGPENIINSAIREALIANGNADVLVALEHQIKYAADGSIESITVTGYPATYANFRTPSDAQLHEYLLETIKSSKKEESDKKGPIIPAGGNPFFGKFMGK